MEHAISTKPFFSIVMPVYNIAKYVGEALDSISAQTFQSWECFCIDDGSTDGSGRLIDGFASTDCRFIPLHTSNHGVSTARNIGIERCSGDWLLFLDGDDVLDTSALELLFNHAKSTKCDMLLFGKEEFVTASWRSSDICGGEGVKIVNIRDYVPPSIFYKYFWQGCYRRAAFGDLRMDPAILFNMGEDQVYYVSALLRVNEVLEITTSLYGYRLRQGSAMHSPRTVEKWHYDFIHYMILFDLIENGGKVFDKSIPRELALRLTEGMAEVLIRMSRIERSSLWQELNPVYMKLSRCKLLSCWIRTTSALYAMSGSFTVFLLLAGFPRFLKRCGLHR